MVETDCLELTKHIHTEAARLYEYKRLETFLHLTSSSLHYAPRQVNMVAHHLAQHVRFASNTLICISPSQLPYVARGYYLTDANTSTLRALD